jgi:hypothetical protein
VAPLGYGHFWALRWCHASKSNVGELALIASQA